MNQYSELLYFLKGLAEAHPLVNTVTKGDPSKLDLEKANIYPLVHVSVEAANFSNGQTVLFDVTLACLSQRDINKEIKSSKFWDNDNEVDNHNETLAILNDIWTRILRDWQKRNITTSEEATLEKIEFEKGNILDGWSLSFQVELPNTTMSLCDGVEYEYTPGTGGGATNNLLWELETATTIKPKNNKLVDAAHLTGEIYGGLFQP